MTPRYKYDASMSRTNMFRRWFVLMEADAPPWHVHRLMVVVYRMTYDKSLHQRAVWRIGTVGRVESSEFPTLKAALVAAKLLLVNSG